MFPKESFLDFGFVYLTDRMTGQESEILHPLVYYPDAHHSQARARRPDPTWVSDLGGRGPGT